MLQPGLELASNRRLLNVVAVEVVLLDVEVVHGKILGLRASFDAFGLLQVQPRYQIGREGVVVEPGHVLLQQLYCELGLVAEAFHLVSLDPEQSAGNSVQSYELSPMVYHSGQYWHGRCQTDACAGAGLEGSWN